MDNNEAILSSLEGLSLGYIQIISPCCFVYNLGLNDNMKFLDVAQLRGLHCVVYVRLKKEAKLLVNFKRFILHQ